MRKALPPSLRSRRGAATLRVLSLTVALAAVGGALSRAARVAPSRVPEPLVHPWQLIDRRHWQILSAAVEDPAVTDTLEGTRGACPEGMVDVRGRVKDGGWAPTDMVRAAQDVTCVDWIDTRFPERCARFDRERWWAVSSAFPKAAMRFCIDRFEYPNRHGAYPWIMVSYGEAGALCGREGKRLCTEQEWTFACEGEEAMPYPYGYDRDSDACVFDRAWREPDAAALVSRDSERAVAELDRLWQGEPSGSRPRCRSPFGVFDMTGNVDEWTSANVPGERPSVLKGGYWGVGRNRCRPSTRAHGRDFAYYQIGFRCCADLPDTSK